MKHIFALITLLSTPAILFGVLPMPQLHTGDLAKVAVYKQQAEQNQDKQAEPKKNREVTDKIVPVIVQQYLRTLSTQKQENVKKFTTKEGLPLTPTHISLMSEVYAIVYHAVMDMHEITLTFYVTKKDTMDKNTLHPLKKMLMNAVNYQEQTCGWFGCDDPQPQSDDLTKVQLTRASRFIDYDSIKLTTRVTPAQLLEYIQQQKKAEAAKAENC